MSPFLFVNIDQNDNFFKPKWITFQENHFKKNLMDTTDFNKHDINIFINNMWQKYAGDIVRQM